MTDVINLATGKEIEAICKEQKSVSPYDGSNIQFTSGTTGKPKATFLTHKSLVNNSHQVSKEKCKKKKKKEIEYIKIFIFRQQNVFNCTIIIIKFVLMCHFFTHSE